MTQVRVINCDNAENEDNELACANSWSKIAIFHTPSVVNATGDRKNSLKFLG